MSYNQNVKILGIETSCDETAAAIVEDGTKVISNAIASSQELHAKYGGIIPENAAREQVKSIIPVIKETLVTNVDAIAVTVGPGLIGSLLVGVETAKSLALVWDKPLIPVNHLVGHIYANWLNPAGTADFSPPEFPALCLLVSGGHSEIILIKDHNKFRYLGGTRDDAAGECLDKCARILGLGYPGGPAIEAAAAGYNPPKEIANILPRPMIYEKNFDFSFSGLKTATQTMAKNPAFSREFIAYELLEAVTDVLVNKTARAMEKYRVKTVLLAGGVAASKRLREKFALHFQDCSIHIPPINLCTDNAAYIASAAYFCPKAVDPLKITADPGLDIS